MTGSSPQPSPKLAPRPPRTRRHRAHRPVFPKRTVGALFVVYVLIGLLLSVPAPPFWVWIPAVVGTVLLALGLNRPMATGSAGGKLAGKLAGKLTDQAGLLSYGGALLLVVALAIAANYIGGGQSLDDVHFLMAVLGLAVLTLLSIALTAAATITSAQTGASLMQIMDYKRSMTLLMGACFCGIFIGGLAGFLSVAL